MTSFLRSKFYYQYSTDDIVSQGKDSECSCDIGKYYDTSFGMNKFSKKKPINFCKYYVVGEPFSSTKCVLITLLG